MTKLQKRAVTRWRRRTPVQPAEPTPDRLFCGIFPAGWSWADRSREEHGDWKRIAFMSFETLVLEVTDPDSPLLGRVEADAQALQAKRGQRYEVSGSGQYVVLGS